MKRLLISIFILISFVPCKANDRRKNCCQEMVKVYLGLIQTKVVYPLRQLWCKKQNDKDELGLVVKSRVQLQSPPPSPPLSPGKPRKKRKKASIFN